VRLLVHHTSEWSSAAHVKATQDMGGGAFIALRVYGGRQNVRESYQVTRLLVRKWQLFHSEASPGLQPGLMFLAVQLCATPERRQVESEWRGWK
jgi:hypothetical protein